MLARYNIIVAIDDDHGIGKDGSIPWNHPADLKQFKERTMRTTVIMGRKTYESIPNRPLKHRRNIVITKESLTEDVETVPSLFEALKLAYSNDIPELTDDVYIIGGAQVYKEALEVYSELM